MDRVRTVRPLDGLFALSMLTVCLFDSRRDLYCNSSMEDKLNSEFLTLNSQQTVEAKNEQNPFCEVIRFALADKIG